MFMRSSLSITAMHLVIWEIWISMWCWVWILMTTSVFCFSSISSLKCNWRRSVLLLFEQLWMLLAWWRSLHMPSYMAQKWVKIYASRIYFSSNRSFTLSLSSMSQFTIHPMINCFVRTLKPSMWRWVYRSLTATKHIEKTYWENVCVLYASRVVQVLVAIHF